MKLTAATGTTPRSVYIVNHSCHVYPDLFCNSLQEVVVSTLLVGQENRRSEDADIVTSESSF